MAAILLQPHLSKWLSSLLFILPNHHVRICFQQPVPMKKLLYKNECMGYNLLPRGEVHKFEFTRSVNNQPTTVLNKNWLFADLGQHQYEIQLTQENYHYWINGTLKNKVEFGTILIYMRSKSVQCITKKALFDVDFGLAASYFIEKNVSQVVNGERYRLMINNFFWPELDNMYTNICWDGASCHIRHSALISTGNRDGAI